MIRFWKLIKFIKYHRKVFGVTEFRITTGPGTIKIRPKGIEFPRKDEVLTLNYY